MRKLAICFRIYWDLQLSENAYALLRTHLFSPFVSLLREKALRCCQKGSSVRPMKVVLEETEKFLRESFQPFLALNEPATAQTLDISPFNFTALL